MSDRSPRTTGDPAVDDAIRALLDEVRPAANRDLIAEVLTTAALLAREGYDRLDLKIASAALAEMRDAFRVFAPYQGRRKVTMFGSARTRKDDPLYDQARQVARQLAAAGWMVVTGAGPGIMAAGMEGAGQDLSIGVNIRLPFEQAANEFIQGDPKLVTMKYFFTRKLMLVKESDGFVVLPGGFGTLDESFELLTLVQTGKAQAAPIVLLDVPGGTYWAEWRRFVEHEVLGRGLIAPDDLSLLRTTDSVDEAVGEILGFYRNYSSMRYVAGRLVLRLRRAPAAERLRALQEEFSDLLAPGATAFEVVAPSPAERSAGDELDKERVAFAFDQISHGRLRQLIDRLNDEAR